MKKATTLYFILGGIVLLLLLLKYYSRTSEGFQEGVDEFVLYYASWCGHCKNVKPIFQSWGAEKGSVQIGGKTVFVRMVEEKEMENEKNKPTIKGYPTFILRKADGSTKEFNGDRSPEGWNAWLKENI